MPTLGLEQHVVDPAVRDATVTRFREARIPLPTFAQLADPRTIPAHIAAALAEVDPDAPHPLNLFRVHWYNDAARRGLVEVPAHLELPSSLTGVDARIVLAIGQRFPMIHAHKVLAAYGCLAPRLVTGQLDPVRQRAVWPSTGNYCRGGLAISRIMGTRGVAVLPEGMSEERFRWLEAWATHPAEDILKTPGSESNVKEIYDACNELDRDPDNIIFNQFCEFG
ncbi:MAG: pyridoxal-5'-phosphate-dependent protein subunit beta, partial [Myxococcales bacterium]|nr:pyridoxal-5'-phosphate-dependent protein subunit beta [Myxococcales bacterium]